MGRKIAFYPDKRNVLFVTRNNKNLIKFNYTGHGPPLESLEEAKYIGLTIGQDLKKKSHVNNVCTKTDKTLGFFRLNYHQFNLSANSETLFLWS